MSWTDMKAFVVDDRTHQSFKSLKKRFHCSLCGHDFKVGDTARWIYANGTKGSPGNFFVCSQCDGETATVIQRGIESRREAVRLAKNWGIYGPDWQQ